MCEDTVASDASQTCLTPKCDAGGTPGNDGNLLIVRDAALATACQAGFARHRSTPQNLPCPWARSGLRAGGQQQVDDFLVAIASGGFKR